MVYLVLNPHSHSCTNILADPNHLHLNHPSAILFSPSTQIHVVAVTDGPSYSIYLSTHHFRRGAKNASRIKVPKRQTSFEASRRILSLREAIAGRGVQPHRRTLS